MMKKNLFFLALLLAGFLSNFRGQTQIWIDDFETTASSSGTRTPENNGGVGGPPFTSYFCRTPANGTVSQSVPFTGFQGTNYWAGEDHDAAGTGFLAAGTFAMSVRQQDITWTGINIAGQSSLSFSGLFAANSTNQPFDNRNACSGGATTNTDYVILQHKIDSGPYVDDLRFFTNGALTGKYLFLETTGDSCGDGAQLLNSFQTFTAAIAGTGTTMALRLLVYSEGSNEEWGVDKFQLFATAACTSPTINTSPASNTICAGSNTTFAATTTGATAYQWQVDDNSGSGFIDLTNSAPYSGVTSNTLSITSASTNVNGNHYRLTAINGVGSCTTNSGYGTLAISTLTATGTQTNVSCNGGSNGITSVAASGVSAPFTYSWSPSGATSSTNSGLNVGIKTVTVTDAIGCTTSQSFTITQPSALVTSTAVTNVACNGGSNGSATITASGGAGSYSYLWSTGSSASSITGRLAGAYTATVTDANSCTSIKSAVVTQPSALVTTTALTTVACNGGSNGSATITASGGAGSYSYLWSNGGSTSAITGLLAGAYTATVTDANSCTSIKSAVVTQPSALVTSTAVTNVACNGGSNGVASITASGGAGSYTYLWSNGGSTSAITGLLAGAYSATVTDANSCTSIKSAVVTQPSALVTSTAITNIACNSGSNGSATITASGGVGGYTYLWSNGATTSAISGLLAGAYSATVTDANSCTSIKSAVVTQPSALVTSTAVTNVACNSGSNGSATITASGGVGGYTYLWSNGATTSAVSGLLAGAYSATVTDANSCTSIKSAVITQPSALVTSTAVTNVACNSGSNGSATITASGGTGSYTYLWSNGATTSAISGLLAGAYSATVTDANSCTSIKSAVITQPSALVTSTAVTNVACNSGSNGSATITASGGTGSYTYLWSNGATTSAVSGLLAGAYSATVTDANSCTSIKSAVITQPSALVTSTAVTNVACNSGSNGSATITASGGVGGYTYLWSNGATTSAVSGLLAGAYSATVTDANSCTSIKSAVITQPSALTLTATASSNSLCSGSSATLTASGSGGTGTLAYSWISGPSTANYTVTPATSAVYTVNALDANGCSKSATIGVTVIANPTVTVNSTTICSGNSVAIVPTGATSYTISGGNYTVTPTTNTSYTVNGTTNGCISANAVSSISVNATPSITVNSATICSNNSVAIVPNGASSYIISGNNYTVSPNTTTSYTVNGTTNGCVSADAVSTISVNTTPTITLNSGAICPGNQYTLQASGAGTYTYSSGSNLVSPSNTTTYSATGTGSNGCAAFNVATATVSVVNTLTLSVSGNTNICSGNAATLTASGASNYLWTNGATTNTVALSPTANTTYTVYGSSGTCSNSAVVSVSVLTSPTITVNSATICAGNSVAIVPSGALSYTITNINFTVTPNITTSYSITGTAANGCAGNQAVSTVSVKTIPAIVVSNTTICSGTTVTLVPTGANTYTITGGSFTVSPTTTTSYSVSGTGTNGCVSSTPAIASVSVNTTPTVTLNGGTICPGNSFTLIPGGADNYTITGNSYTVTPASTTSYALTGSSLAGCISVNPAVATVNVVNTLTINVSGNTTICNGNTTTLTATGATTYSWTSGDVTNTVVLNPTSSTAYTVLGVSGTCSSTAVFSVSVNPLPTITVNSGTICNGTSIIIAPNGASTYSVSGGSFTVTPTSNSSYTINGTDVNGCVSSDVISTIHVNALPVVNAVATTPTICVNATGSLTASGALSYSWSNGQSSDIIAVGSSSAGVQTYTVTGTDANGCVNTATVSQVTDECTGIKNTSAIRVMLGVYPNPTTGSFVVETPENTAIFILNATGETVQTQIIGAGKTTVTIDHLANGIYFVKAVANGSQQIVKIIKE